MSGSYKEAKARVRRSEKRVSEAERGAKLALSELQKYYTDVEICSMAYAAEQVPRRSLISLMEKKLPTELREMVYGYLLDDDTIESLMKFYNKPHPKELYWDRGSGGASGELRRATPKIPHFMTPCHVGKVVALEMGERAYRKMFRNVSASITILWKVNTLDIFGLGFPPFRFIRLLWLEWDPFSLCKSPGREVSVRHRKAFESQLELMQLLEPQPGLEVGVHINPNTSNDWTDEKLGENLALGIRSILEDFRPVSEYFTQKGIPWFAELRKEGCMEMQIDSYLTEESPEDVWKEIKTYWAKMERIWDYYERRRKEQETEDNPQSETEDNADAETEDNADAETEDDPDAEREDDSPFDVENMWESERDDDVEEEELMYSIQSSYGEHGEELEKDPQANYLYI